MEYRINRRTGDKISIIGIGTSSISEADEKEAVETLRKAFESGINYFDLASADCAKGNKHRFNRYGNV